jgi:hypothetical protein
VALCGFEIQSADPILSFDLQICNFWICNLRIQVFLRT